VDQFEDNNKEFDEQTVEIKNEYDRNIPFKLEQLSSQAKDYVWKRHYNWKCNTK
jgi:hypothetical protein